MEGHFTGPTQWLSYHRLVSAQLARVVGALPSEVVAMNTLSVNLHLMMVSFYRPTTQRPCPDGSRRIPDRPPRGGSSDPLPWFRPGRVSVEVQPDEANGTISLAAIERAIAEHGPRLALVLWPGVQYRTARPSTSMQSPAPHACRGRASVSTWRIRWATRRCACMTWRRTLRCGAH